jgi:hypothetical protein
MYPTARAGQQPTTYPTPTPGQQPTMYATPMPGQRQTQEAPIQYPVPVVPNYTTQTPAYIPLPSAWREKIAYNTAADGRKRSAVGITLGIILFLLGGLLFAFGLACVAIPTENNAIVGVAFFIGLLLTLLALVYTLVLHRRPLLRGWMRVILFFVLFILTIIALFVVFSGAHGDTTNPQYIGLGVICALYGIGLGIIALI